jgi:hypothetical protein
MASNIAGIDASDFLNNLKRLGQEVLKIQSKSVRDIAYEVLRLSSFEVPHDKGLLQNSGTVENDGGEAIVGYNKVYAARLHEHPEYHFQKGRKGKYLEDPVKNNLDVFKKYTQNAVEEGLK